METVLERYPSNKDARENCENGGVRRLLQDPRAGGWNMMQRRGRTEGQEKREVAELLGKSVGLLCAGKFSWVGLKHLHE